ncbi:hypothetical protein SAMN06295909_0493 [Plantibacter sp. VKM Ac-1784]|uniref:Asp23/Gls24 family envelope stress response protein n=1 Tax=Plantibacter elymi (nom. nud.) TaxID=199708 RepID=A0ABY1R8H2_9MICO|nr:hypothetical protein [Plantibacter sp. VKM Ac-1784]SMQ60757.1 hypothetical protein SAMN06295909_0493 [Plantibacter sp. VKM Ac-1784]
MDTDAALSQQLTAVVAATPGVTTVYASGSPIRAVLRTVADAVGRDDDGPTKVAVGRGADGALTIGATIGVTDGAPVPATLRLVGDAIRGVLATSMEGTPIHEIDVRVCRIEDAAPLGTPLTSAATTL